jgi:hypothetical protein
LLWDEYVEDITEQLRSPRRAREVRREIRDHLLCLKEQFVAEGLSPDEAEQRAIEVLGPAEVLACAFREMERPYRPLWPVGVTLAAILWAVASQGIPGSQPGPSLLILAWALLWGLFHGRAFLSIASRRRSGRLVPSGIDWAHLFPAAWRYLGAGAVFAIALALLVSPNVASLGLFGVLVAVAIGSAALLVAHRSPWVGAERSPLHHPISSLLATVGVLLTLTVLMTLVPATNITDSFPYGLPGQHFTYGDAVQWSFVNALPFAGLVGALYVTGCTVAHWAVEKLLAPSERIEEMTLRLD